MSQIEEVTELSMTGKNLHFDSHYSKINRNIVSTVLKEYTGFAGKGDSWAIAQCPNSSHITRKLQIFIKKSINNSTNSIIRKHQNHQRKSL